MSYRPITYCRQCGEPFDVYRAPEDRICDGCLETMGEEAELEDDEDDGQSPFTSSNPFGERS